MVAAKKKAGMTLPIQTKTLQRCVRQGSRLASASSNRTGRLITTITRAEDTRMPTCVSTGKGDIKDGLVTVKSHSMKTKK